MNIDDEYATVDDMIEKLKELSARGYGGYQVTCNDEYALARQGEQAIVDNSLMTVDFGGYNVL